MLAILTKMEDITTQKGKNLVLYKPFMTTSSSKTIYVVMVAPNLNTNPNTITSLQANLDTIQNQNITRIQNQSTIPITIQDQNTNLDHHTIQNQNTILLNKLTIGNHSTIPNQHITTIQTITCPQPYDHLYLMGLPLLYHSVHCPNHPMLVLDLMDILENTKTHTKNIKVKFEYKSRKMLVIFTSSITRSLSWS